MKRIANLAASVLAGLILSGTILAADVSSFNLPNAPIGPQGHAFVRSAPTYVNARVLAANVSETDTVPTGANWVLFSSDCNFYAATGATATVPAADVTDGTSPEQNPAGWYIPAITQITVVAAATCKVTLTYYK